MLFINLLISEFNSFVLEADYCERFLRGQPVKNVYSIHDLSYFARHPLRTNFFRITLAHFQIPSCVQGCLLKPILIYFPSLKILIASFTTINNTLVRFTRKINWKKFDSEYQHLEKLVGLFISTTTSRKTIINHHHHLGQFLKNNNLVLLHLQEQGNCTNLPNEHVDSMIQHIDKLMVGQIFKREIGSKASSGNLTYLHDIPA